MNEKHPQRAIPEHNDLLNLTINNLPIGVILFDPKGNVLFSNTQGAQYLGYNSTEDLISIKDLDSMRKHLLETFIIKNESGELYTADKSPVMIAINEKRNNQYIAHFINKKNGQLVK